MPENRGVELQMRSLLQAISQPFVYRVHLRLRAYASDHYQNAAAEKFWP
jgi:hypothetical protein